MSQQILEQYTELEQGYQQQLKQKKKKAKTMSVLRLLSFFAFLMLLGLAMGASQQEPSSTFRSLMVPFVLISPIFLAIFIAFAWHHEKLKSDLLMLSRLLQFNKAARAKLNSEWTQYEQWQGTIFSDPQHLYCEDLDLFGPGSIFQLINSCYANLGQQKLSLWLKQGTQVEKIKARQDAITELAPRLAFHHNMAAQELRMGNQEKKLQLFLKWLGSEERKLTFSKTTIMALYLPWITFVGLFLNLFFLNWQLNSLWLLPVLISWAFVRINHQQSSEAYDKISNVSEGILAYRELFHLLEQESKDFKSQELLRLTKLLDNQPTQTIQQLADITTRLDYRHGMIYPLINIAFLWDIRNLLALETWCQQNKDRLEIWLDVLYQIEALNSLATFAFTHPDFTYPIFTLEETKLEGKNLGHPCIDNTKRVANDFTLDKSCKAAIITGSNMSGKSTMLRTLGVNIALANCGAPVCAEKLYLSRFELRTSMRAKDNLQEGMSFFYAELTKLKQVIDGIGTEYPMFFLLDEVLAGTNTRERSIASCAIVKHLSSENTLGTIATHDLALTKLVEENPHIQNFHFTDNILDNEIHFDHKICQGPVTTSNALFLMRKVGIKVVTEK